MIARFINGNQYVDYNIDEGSTITENYNETLDSASIRISHLPSRMNIEVLDSCILIDTRSDDPTKKLKDRYMVVDNWVETEQGLYDLGKTYTYEISLSSPTKQLEGIILPNLSITNTTHSHSIMYYLQLYLDLYGPKIRKYVGGVLILTAKWHFSDNFIGKFTRKCPEFQWNMPTLREVLTDLMMVVDCIPILKRNDRDNVDVANEIDLIDLTVKKDAVSSYNYIRRAQSLSDYVSELQMQMQNVLQTSVPGVSNTVTTTEFLTFKTDSYVITENQDYFLETEYPILSIKHLYMWIFYPEEIENSNNAIPIRTDLLNLRAIPGDNGASVVYEKKAYDMLNILYRTPAVVDDTKKVEDYYSKYTAFCIYYTRGSNRIGGFSKVNKGYTLNIDKSTLNWLKSIAFKWIVKNFNLTSAAEDINNGASSYFTTLFQIEYETTADTMYRAGKSIRQKHDRITIDNQTNSYVDAYNQGNLEYQKVNRLGNQSLTINQRVDNDNLTDLLKIGDYYEDNIIYQAQYQIYDEHIESYGIATKNYILKDYFTGVKSKVRTWSNAREEAFYRNELKKYYVELGFKQINSGVSCVDATIFAKALSSIATNPILYCALKTDTTNNYYSVNVTSRVIGNSIAFTFGFNDNFYVGKYVDTEISTTDIESSSFANGNSIPFHLINANLSDYGGIPMQYYTYTDNDGEFTTLYVYLCEDLDNIRFNNTSSPSDYKTKFIKSCRRPLVHLADLIDVDITDSLILYKDNREIPKVTMQFEFCTRDRNIYFTKEFVARQPLIRTTSRTSLKIYWANKSKYELNKEELPSSAVEISNISVTTTYIADDCCKWEVSLGADYSTNLAYYIADINGNLLIGMLIPTTTTTTNKLTLYFNVLDTRDTNIYDDAELIIGSIET